MGRMKYFRTGILGYIFYGYSEAVELVELWDCECNREAEKDGSTYRIIRRSLQAGPTGRGIVISLLRGGTCRRCGRLGRRYTAGSTRSGVCTTSAGENVTLYRRTTGPRRQD